MKRESIRCKCPYRIDKCNPCGGHGDPDDLFGQIVYCGTDGKPCMVSPYLTWGYQFKGLKMEDERVVAGETYDQYMKRTFGTTINDKREKSEVAK